MPPDSPSRSEAIPIPIDEQLGLPKSEAPQPQEAPFSLKERALSSSFWSLSSFGFHQILRLARNLILTRLLFPEAFGLVALTNTFISGLRMFSDLGLRPHIIRSKRGEDPEFLNTAWTLQNIRGLVLWLMMCVLAWPVARFYEDSRFLLLLPILGFEMVIFSLGSNSLTVLYRNMNLKKVKLFSAAVGIIGTFTTVLVAWIYPTVWALIIGTLFSSVVATIGSHFLVPGFRNRFAWNPEIVRSLFSFGKWIFVSTVFTFLAMQSDRLIIAKLLSIEFLGVYSIALMLSELPKQLVSRLSQEILYPMYARLSRVAPETTFEKIIKIRWATLLLCCFTIGMLITVGDLFILFIYDDRYHQAALYFPFLALGIWFYVLANTISPAIIALGKPQYSALGNFLRFALIGVGLPMAYGLYDLKGVVILMAFAALPQYLAMSFGLKRQGLSVTSQDIKATTLFILFLGFLLWLRVMLGFGNPFYQIFI